MKKTKLVLMSIIWLFFMIITVAVISAWPRKEEFCLLSYPPQCMERTTYGWPRPIVVKQGTDMVFQQSNVWFAIFVLLGATGVSLSVIWLIIQKGMNRANTRD